jgi:isoleucyl-tRNA synthetase
VSVHPEFEYVVLFAGERYLVVAKELVEAFVEAVGYEEHKIIKTITGAELEGITYSHPLNGKVCPVVLADYVTLESGTGLVHTAPGHGEDDFMTGKNMISRLFASLTKKVI